MPVVKSPNSEPLPGYRLLNLIGRGGFGEIWKCVAPGGVIKAVKFVPAAQPPPLGGDLTLHCCAANQERKALERIAAIRHPYLLSIDRVELIDSELVVVMELADGNLHEVLTHYVNQGQGGIPRPDLLKWMAEAAEVVDMMNQKHQLQHLDIKPRNLFLIANHLKLADFGLLSSLKDLHPGNDCRQRLATLTPRYAAPETFDGTFTEFSDQYSLAITYHELLTGTLPFRGSNVKQLAMQHLGEEPVLDSLPAAERVVVRRALAKKPKERFPSCTAMVQALRALATVKVVIPSTGGEEKEVVAYDPVGDQDKPGPDADTDSDLANEHLASTAVVQPSPLSSGNISGNASSNAPLPKALPGPLPPLERSSASVTDGFLLGYQFEECLMRSPLGEVWNTRAPDRRHKRVQLLFGSDLEAFTEQASEGANGGANGLARLRAIRHPGLAEAEFVHWAPGRLAVIVDAADGCLADHFTYCRQEGQPGIPREELLEDMRGVAEILDELYQEHHLQHLALNPRQLMTSGGNILLADFGLTELLWVPGGHQPGTLNPRYSAPELFHLAAASAPKTKPRGGIPGSLSGVRVRTPVLARETARILPDHRCDPYSLALIYAELLTGVHPFHNLSSRQLANPRLRAHPDLGQVPLQERPALSQALHPDPARRTATCGELVAKLTRTGRSTTRGAFSPTHRLIPDSPDRNNTQTLPDGLPPVSPLPAPGPEAVGMVPASGFLLNRVLGEILGLDTRSGQLKRLGNQHVRIKPGKRLEHQCFGPILPETLHLKIEGFRQKWQATCQPKRERCWLMQVRLPGTLWQRLRGMLPGLEVLLEAHYPTDDPYALTRIQITIRPLRDTSQEAAKLLDELGLEMLEDLRTYLGVLPERRRHERFPRDHAIRVFPVFDHGEFGEPIQGQMRDLGMGGVCLALPQRLPTELVCVPLASPRQPTPLAVHGRVVRRELAEGSHLTGVCFLPAR